jgi:hypothetical protein
LPGTAYQFSSNQQEEYYQMYRDSMFAMTQKKGGWDCLRHYEILANGCIPIFQGLHQCPDATMTQFPKALVANAMDALSPWDVNGYEAYVEKLLEHTRSHLSCSALARFFLERMSLWVGRPVRKVLMLTGHSGTNYSREMLWIGLSRMLNDSEEGIAIEWPRLDALYDDFPVAQLAQIYGNGFTYSRRLLSEFHGRGNWTESEIRASIVAKEWDVVLYGKVGVDETVLGSVPNLPFWSEISGTYGPEEIAFLYGGDGCQDMTIGSVYGRHLLTHMDRGVCFVREIRTS